MEQYTNENKVVESVCMKQGNAQKATIENIIVSWALLCFNEIKRLQGGAVPMEIRVLRYFLTVVREESITKAADVLHITQPTLSRQLSQMENEIGVRLFHRGTRLSLIHI